MKTAKLRDEKEVLDRQQEADIEAKKNLEENLQQLENRKQELEAQEKQMQTRLKKILDTVEKHREECKKLERDQQDLKSKLIQSRYSYFCSFKKNSNFFFLLGWVGVGCVDNSLHISCI